MNIYLLSQTENNDYDTYDSCVVLADTEQEARLIHPSERKFYRKELNSWMTDSWYDRYLKQDLKHNISRYTSWEWCNNPEQVIVEYIGEFKGNLDEYPSRIICSSYNAG